ncbi:MAG: hypothetical protein AAGG07_09005 [Planctomycetota bacterium]
MRRIDPRVELKDDPEWYARRSRRLNRLDIFWTVLVLGGCVAGIWFGLFSPTLGLVVVVAIGGAIALLVARDRSSDGKELARAAGAGWRVCFKCDYELGEPADGEPEPKGSDQIICPECGTEWTHGRLRDHWHREHLDYVRRTTILSVRKV